MRKEIWVEEENFIRFIIEWNWSQEYKFMIIEFVVILSMINSRQWSSIEQRQE